MKIVVAQNKEDVVDLLDTFDNIELDLFDYEAVFTADAEATSTDVLKMVLKAMLLEGYHLKSILNSMKDIYEYESSESDIDLED